MMTRAPNFAPPDVAPQKHAGYTTQVREYELITPLFGGGAVAQEADAVSVVRVPSIRGQLRFWWRATRGANAKGSLTDMRTREEYLWGMAGSDKPTASKVSLSLEVIDPGTPRSWRDISGVDYAIFPLRGSDKRLVTGVKFALTITYPSGKAEADDVAAALWAWETFGGLGARTRRGFGAVRCVRVDGKDVELPGDKAALEAAIRSGLAQHVAPGEWPKDIPHLTQQTAFKVTPPQQNANSAWSYLVSKLKSFRQFRTGNQGRSYWPEPDAIRKITGKSAPAHSDPIVANVTKFPRAQFGLPIIFHFRLDGHRRGDPDDTSLEGAKTDRHASPLILRPLVTANGRAFGLAVVLSGPRVPHGLVLKRGRNPLRTVEAEVSPQESAKIRPLNGKTDVLQAFLDTL
jgi:CRISPR-associated protein Cmr1